MFVLHKYLKDASVRGRLSIELLRSLKLTLTTFLLYFN